MNARAIMQTCPLQQQPEMAELKQKQLGSSADEVPLPKLALKGKPFDGWLKASAPDGGKHAGRAAGESGGSDDDESGVDSDEGGEAWYEREHLAAPPAGWHRPVARKTATKKHATKRDAKKHVKWVDRVNQFHGEGADAAPATLEEEEKKGVKPFGSGRPENFVSTQHMQTLHRQHRTIAGLLMDPKEHAQHKAVDLPGRA